ncbi:MAG: cupin domain-containing protein [Vicinamibacterales bacterium]
MTIPSDAAFALRDLVAATPDGIASRVLSKEAGGSLTLFAFDAGQGLSEHVSPAEALILVTEGTFSLTVGVTRIEATANTAVRLPAGVPHSVEASTAGRMLLFMLKVQR